MGKIYNPPVNENVCLWLVTMNQRSFQFLVTVNALVLCVEF